MPTIARFEDIAAWKLARQLCARLGKMIDEGLFKNNYRLISQIEGSSGSIMDNIAEGFERGMRLEFITFLGYAKASCGEFRSQLYRALDRQYLQQAQFDELFSLSFKISVMIYRFILYLQKTPIKGLRKK
ncbi:MAG: four helix bundle protein [Chitinophagaceae bacterium]|nr:four helix bundle protein [Chitinophagaceae bacterium]